MALSRLIVLALAAALAPAPSFAAAPERPLSPALLRERGFVPYLGHWVLPERREELLKTLPSVGVLNRTREPVRVLVDGLAAGVVEPEGAAAFPATAGLHRVSVGVGRRDPRTFPLETARGYNARIEVLPPEDAPTVLPSLPGREARERSRTVRGDDYTVRIVDGEPRAGSFRKVFTRERKWVLAPRGKEVGFDRDTWRVTEAIVCDRRGAALCLSDPAATWLLNDARLDREMYLCIAAALPPQENPALSDLLSAAARLKIDALVPYALPALQHEFGIVRARAADALGDLGTPAVLPRLRNFFQVEKDAYVARRIEAAIARIEARERAAAAAKTFWEADDRGKMAVLDEMRKHPEDVPVEFVLDVYRRSEAAAFREVAVRMMADLPPEAVGPTLIRALDDGEPSVRAFALASIARLALLEALPAVVARLEDPAAEVRGAAAAALGDLGLAEAVPPLLARLEDDDKWVRHAASAALERITGQPFRLAPDADEAQRKSVIEQWRAWWEGRPAPAPAAPAAGPDAGGVTGE